MMKKALLVAIITLKFVIVFAQTEAEKFKNENLADSFLSSKELKSKLIRYRIPNSQGLDGGAGEFSPNDKYLSAGWQTVRVADTSSKNKTKALQTEKAKWWE